MKTQARASMLVATLCLPLALSACGTGGSGSAPPQTSAAEVVQPSTTAPDPTPTPTPSVLGPARTWTAVMSQGGYNVTVTFELHDAIHDKSGKALEAAWAEVGGSSPVACLGSRHGLANAMYDAQGTASAFGTLRMHSDSNGFTPPAWVFHLRSSDGYLEDHTVMGAQYSSGNDCKGFEGLGRYVGAEFTEGVEDWGPVPIVFGFADTYGPEQPNGGRLAVPEEGLTFLANGVDITLTGPTAKKATGIKFKLAKEQPDQG